jgi:hypothetical protein
MHIASWSIAVLLAFAPVSLAQQTTEPAPLQTTSGTGFTIAPYSGKETTVTVRMLADGTTSKQTSVQLLWRDAEGRTRRELIQHTVSGAEYRSIVVTDPVAEVYVKWETGNPNARRVVSIWPITPGLRATTPAPSGSPGNAATVAASGVSRPDFQRETLTPQYINGVYAEGTRTTRTVRLEEDNGGRLIKVTNELWISPDLKIIVRHILDDPRSGISTTDVTDVVRGDPDPALFQAPEGYAVVDHTVQNSR